MVALFALPRRVVEATPAELVATGAYPGGRDPLDGDVGYHRAGASGRPVPWWTLEQARAHSVAGYRANPMARAIIDTYTSFAVGDSGVKLLGTNPEVEAIAREFWEDPRVDLENIAELLLRSHMLNGETVLELLQGNASGAVRISPIDPAAVGQVELMAGNPLWPTAVQIQGRATADGVERRLTVAGVDDETHLREGQVAFWPSWKTLATDVRGFPFLAPVLDQLTAYDQTISNLIDRTALARYLVWDVKVDGGQTEIDAYLKARGGSHVPPSGSVEIHNQSVEWTPKTAPTGADEDSVAASTVLTEVSAGAGLAKTWLAEPDGANRATSHSMAEPVRRRVGGVQRMWLGLMTELVRFAVDRAVAAGRLPATVDSRDPRTGHVSQVPASRTVRVQGPEVAASDAEVAAATMLNLSTGLGKFVEHGIMTREAAGAAAEKAWEQFVGIPFNKDFAVKKNITVDDIATYMQDNAPTSPAPAGAAREANSKGHARALHAYWTRGEGLAQWRDKPHPWTALYHHLRKYISDDDEARRTASQWYHDVTGHWPAEGHKEKAKK